jgi:hypothetical protein
MVVMVAIGSWSLGHTSTVGIVYVFYTIPGKQVCPGGERLPITQFT